MYPIVDLLGYCDCMSDPLFAYCMTQFWYKFVICWITRLFWTIPYSFIAEKRLSHARGWAIPNWVPNNLFYELSPAEKNKKDEQNRSFPAAISDVQFSMNKICKQNRKGPETQIGLSGVALLKKNWTCFWKMTSVWIV